MKLITTLNAQQTQTPMRLIVGAIASILLMTGCTPKQERLTCDPPKIDPLHLQKSETANLSIFIDGTPSMAGYVSSGSDSLYQKTLDSIERAASTPWSKPQYFRFGQQKQVIDRDTYRTAKLPSFYQGGANFSVSRIDQVLSEAASDRVSIIVTDLYQKGADVELLKKQLTQNYLAQGYSIGILAVKSEFKGTIYDVGLTGQQFQYSTIAQKAQSYHPFYVLVLGNYGNVNHFYEQLQRNGISAVDHKFFMFSPQLVRQVAVLDPHQTDDTTNKEILSPKAINDGKAILRASDNAPVQFLAISRRAKATTLSKQVTYFPLANALQPAVSEPTLKAQQYSTKLKNFEPTSLQGVQLQQWVVTPKSLDFKLDLQPEKINPGVYQLTADVTPKELQELDWWKTWSADENSLDGSKTNNLSPFLNGLRWNTLDSIQKQNPAIAKLCYALHKK